MHCRKWSRSLAILAALGACAPGGEHSRLAEGDPEEGAKVFLRRCKVCHWIGEDAKNRRGPLLNGVVGREVASVEAFDYSAAFLTKKAEGLVWTPENLDAHLADPQRFIPGTSMSFPGLEDPGARADVIAYLARFR